MGKLAAAGLIALSAAAGCAHPRQAATGPPAAAAGQDAASVPAAPRLRPLTPQTLPAFRQEFDQAKDELRYIAIFSPT